MPELPEVETIVRGLKRKISGKKLRRFFVFDRAKIARPRLPMQLKITAVGRRGKYIICEAGKGLKCVIHLRMTGGLILGRQMANSREQIVKSRHERARFVFSDSSALSFVDTRRFGTINWLKGGESLPRLGVEPLSRDFNADFSAKIFCKSPRAIKSALLDQRLVAGIGNIYADEALWLAKINPERRMNSLNAPETARLAASIKKVLGEAIKSGGSTLKDYKRIDGSPGGYQNLRKVYGREGEKCFRCGAIIKKVRIGGRSASFCPRCQK